MTTIHIRAEDLPKVLRAHERMLPQAIRAGILLAAERGRTLLVRESPVYLGQYKNSWKVKHRGDGPTIENDAPHAGIIELGARPHKVNRAGIDALTEWVKKKLLLRAKKLGPIKPAVYGPKQQKPVKYGPKKPPSVQSAAASAVKQWKLDDMARSIAFAIAKKLEKHGQKGLFIVQNNMPKLSKFLAAEVARQINKALKDKGF